MLDIQLGRRNLSPIQRIAIAEKYRPLYEKEAREKQSKAGKEYGNGGTKLTENLPQASDKEKKERNPTTDKELAEVEPVEYDVIETKKGIQAVNVLRTSLMIIDGEDIYKITLLAQEEEHLK